MAVLPLLVPETITQRTMRCDMMVMPQPSFDQDLGIRKISAFKSSWRTSSLKLSYEPLSVPPFKKEKSFVEAALLNRPSNFPPDKENFLLFMANQRPLTMLKFLPKRISKSLSEYFGALQVADHEPAQ